MMASAAAATRGDPLIVLPNLHDKGHDWPKLMSWESVRSSGKRKMVLWDDRGKEVGGVKNGRESEEDRWERPE